MGRRYALAAVVRSFSTRTRPGGFASSSTQSWSGEHADANYTLIYCVVSEAQIAITQRLDTKPSRLDFIVFLDGNLCMNRTATRRVHAYQWDACTGAESTPTRTHTATQVAAVLADLVIGEILGSTMNSDTYFLPHPVQPGSTLHNPCLYRQLSHPRVPRSRTVLSTPSQAQPTAIHHVSTLPPLVVSTWLRPFFAVSACAHGTKIQRSSSLSVHDPLRAC